jgi:hypothetical protein
MSHDTAYPIGDPMVEAVYHDQVVHHYADNPCTEALPPILDEDEVVRRLGKRPYFAAELRDLPNHIRDHYVYGLTNYFEVLPLHKDLERRFSRMIRNGYVERNPHQYRAFWGAHRERVPFPGMAAFPSWQSRSSGRGFSIIGTSGVGKTTSINAVLSLYPQVILHNHYRGQNFTFVQVTWLKLDCPHDGSIKGFCINFFQRIDSLLNTSYYINYARRGKATVDEMIPAMRSVSWMHGLGVLIIDEIQNLRGHSPRRHREGRDSTGESSSNLLNFLVQLDNEIGVPIVRIGIFSALPLLTGSLHQARRGTGQGDLMWHRMAHDPLWEYFLQGLWRYQYVKNPARLTDDLSAVLYQVSAGITDIAVKVFILAQYRAIYSGHETVDENVIVSVAMDNLGTLQPLLKDMVLGNARAVEDYEDRYPAVAESLERAIQHPQA